jgi:hypothetical protein
MFNLTVHGRMLLTELETSARTENKRMTKHNTPQLSRMGLPIHCATFPGLSRLNTKAVQIADTKSRKAAERVRCFARNLTTFAVRHFKKANRNTK